MANVWVDTGGAATNSGSSDVNTGLAVTVDASYAGGATIQLASNPDLSGVVTSGDSQSSVYFADATNANQKIFWITAVDDAATPNTITVSVAPTGLTAGTSTGTIGGRILLSGITGFESFLRAGDTVNINNSPASAAGPLLTLRTAGSATDGYVKIKGTSGYPTLTSTNTSACITGGVAFQWIEGLTLVQQGATGSALDLTGTGADNWMIYNNKITDSGGDAINIASGSSGTRIIGNEISGAGALGIDASDTVILILFNYIHDVATNGIFLNTSTNMQVIAFNIIDTCTGRGILKSGTSTHILLLLQNIIYGCGDSGFENANATMAVMFNNIFMNNGDAAGEYNLEGGSMFAALSLGNYNCFYDGGAGDNLSNYTAGANDITTDPAFTDAANGDFSLGSSSPAKATGFPGAFIGGLSTGYMDMGAIQRQEPAGGGGGLLTNPGMAGGMRG